MATVKLGRVRPVLKGDYDPTLSYEAMDCVRRNGNVYQAVREVPAGALPETSDSIYWICIGMKGADGQDGQDGKDGADGAPGPQGEPGPQGIQGESGPQGPAGADGAAGPQGPSGPQGPKGDTPPLYSGVDSTAKDVAAAAYAVKTAYDKAVAAENMAVQVGKTPATPDDLGMVRIGQGISVDETGLISTEPVTLATPDAPGIVQVGAGLEVTLPTEAAEGEEAPTPGVLSLGAHASEDPDAYGKGDFQFYGHVKLTDDFEEPTAAKDGVGISPVGVKKAWDRIMGAKEQVTITTSRSWIVPETATYSVTCIGGGGSGGKGGSGTYITISGGSVHCAAGGGGGGGGAGQVVTRNISLTKGTEIDCVIGGSSSPTTFGTDVTALGGGNGGKGGNGTATTDRMQGGGGGAAGATYGSTAAAGGTGGTRADLGGYYPSASGGGGGAGGITSWSPYGDGGRGGNGGNVSYPNTSGGAGGSAGSQGCIMISIPVGG